MIHLPRRSVTRFFVPLIDVLILLFCIFLLMPFVSRPGDDLEDMSPADPRADLPEDVKELQDELLEARRKLEQYEARQAALADYLRVKVLHIDADDGRLFVYDEPNATGTVKGGRRYLTEQSQVQTVIDAQKRAAEDKELLFLILYPRETTGFPLQEQLDTYERWFQDVPMSFEKPS